MRLVGAGDDHEARGVLVQAVDDARGARRPRRRPGGRRARRRASPRGGPARRERPGRRASRSPPGDRPSGRSRRRTCVSPRHARALPSASSSGSGPAKATSARVTAPRVIAMSATLNEGHAGKSMKSMTPSRARRSIRLPTAPPARSPTASHANGRSRLNANQPTTSTSAAKVTRKDEPLARVAQEAEGHAVVLHVDEVEKWQYLVPLPHLDRVDHERLRRAGRGRRPAAAARSIHAQGRAPERSTAPLTRRSRRRPRPEG